MSSTLCAVDHLPCNRLAISRRHALISANFLSPFLSLLTTSSELPIHDDHGQLMDAKTLFEILIREHTDMLVAYLRAGVRDLHAVDDLYQETVLVAWKRLDSYDRAKPFGPWLRGISGKLMLAYYRKTSSGATPLDGQALEWLNDRFAAIHSMPGDAFHEKLAALRECIEALPEAYQRPIIMRFNEERGISEIESILQVARETLKKRLARGKTRLAQCLERKLGLDGAQS